MRQAGIIAAAGLYALKNNVEALALDHVRARRLASALARMARVSLDVAQVESNIVIFDVIGHEAAGICAALAEDVLLLPLRTHPNSSSVAS